MRLHLAALCAALLASCESMSASVYNFGELHPAPARHAYAARTMSAGQYTIHAGMSAALATIGVSLSEVEPSVVDDPAETCMALLIELREYDSSSFGVASTQVELFARAAAFDPWCLSRELAARELGHAGARLGLEREGPAPIAASQPAAADLEALLQAIVAAGAANVKRPSPERQAEFDRACEAVAALGLDFERSLSVLSRINVVLRAASDDDARTAGMRKLSLVLQRRAIASALELALADSAPSGASGSDPGWPSDRVQAAAVEASVEAFGDVKLAQILGSNPFRARDSARLIAVLEAVERRGLPEASALGLADTVSDPRGRWLEGVYLSAVEHPDGRVRLAAMRALGMVSGKGLFSTRADDWFEWWQAQKPPAAKDSTP